jgi:hypothetical protein
MGSVPLLQQRVGALPCGRLCNGDDGHNQNVFGSIPHFFLDLL